MWLLAQLMMYAAFGSCPLLLLLSDSNLSVGDFKEEFSTYFA